MAIQFCDDCGNTLPISVRKEVICDCCGKSNENRVLNTETVSSSSNFPSLLRTKLRSKVAAPNLAERPEMRWPIIDDPCEKCGAKQTRYTTFQARGADEGTTVMRFCTECGHRTTQNN
ncbi:hypothetical protein F5Y12DRAFT_733693 [Xylaria sp. FL1777]|nr:hypothetical protein F5Y12DRAFT_733693 [Xylaria sp. FL1777]